MSRAHFDPGNPIDAACEAERQAALEFILSRMAAKADASAIMTGLLSALCGLAISASGEATDDTRQLLHTSIDMAWPISVEIWERPDQVGTA